MNVQGQQPTTLTYDERSLLETIIEKKLKQIKPTIESTGIIYDELEDYMIKNELDWEHIREMLSSLENKKYLIVKGNIRVLICPKCSSPHIYSKFSCIKCQSTELLHKELIEHKLCGYVATKDKFFTQTEAICPNCKRKLDIETRQKGFRQRRTRTRDREYEVIGSAFECENCEQRFERPDIVHVCQNCDLTFNYKNGRYEKLLIYEVIDDVISKLDQKKDIDILLVEDNSDDANIIVIYLEKSNEKYVVDVINTGEKGIEKIENKLYDMILLDYNLPDMTALDLLKIIKNKGIKTPVIVLTGADDRGLAVDSMKLGASDYVIKSVETYELLPKLIKKIIEEN